MNKTIANAVIATNIAGIRNMFENSRERELEVMLSDALELAIEQRFFQDAIGRAEFYSRVNWSQGEALISTEDLDLDSTYIRTILNTSVCEEFESRGFSIEFYPGEKVEIKNPVEYHNRMHPFGSNPQFMIRIPV